MEQQVDHVVGTYIDQLSSFVSAVSKASQSREQSVEAIQSALLLQLDPLFETDKAMQSLLKQVSEGDSLSAAIREHKDKLHEANNLLVAREQEILAEMDVVRQNLRRVQSQLLMLQDVCTRIDQSSCASKKKTGTPRRASTRSSSRGRRRDSTGKSTATEGEDEDGGIPITGSSSTFPLDCKALLAMGERLALTRGPPLNWDAQVNPQLRGHRPPYPTEDLMRCSTLFRVMNTQDQLTEMSGRDASVADPTAPMNIDDASYIAEPQSTASSRNTRPSRRILDLDL